MNFFELLVFLTVTVIIGAVAGLVVGPFTVGVARAAMIGAFAGPVVGALGIALLLAVSRPAKTESTDEDDDA